MMSFPEAPHYWAMMSAVARRLATLSVIVLTRPANAFAARSVLGPLRTARCHRPPARGLFVAFDEDDFNEPSTKRTFSGSTYASAGTERRSVTYERMADGTLAGWLTIGAEKLESEYVFELKALVLEHFGGTVVEALADFTMDPVYIDVKLNGGETITLHSYENMGVAVFAMTLDPSNEAAVRRVADHVQQLGVFRR